MTLKKRDIGVILLAAAGLFFLLYYWVVISPALSRQKELSGLLASRKAELQEMMALQQRWEIFQTRRTEAETILKQRGERFTLLTYLERISREAGIDSQIQYIKPVSFPEQEGPLQPSGIETRINGLDISQLVNFLYRLEQSGNLLTIPKIKIQPTGKEGDRKLELTLQVNTYIRGPTG